MNITKSRVHGLVAVLVLSLLVAALLAGCAEEEPKTLAGGWSNTETGSSLTGRVLREDTASDVQQQATTGN